MANSVWDDIKEYFKPPSQKRKERAEKLDDALEKDDELLRQLEQLQKEYDDAHPEVLPDFEELYPSDSGLREKSFDSIESDSEIENRERKASDALKAAEKGKLEASYNSKQSANELEHQQAADDLDSAYKELVGAYSDKRSSAVNNAIKNGVARGSILSGEMDRLDSGEQAEKDARLGEYVSEINKLDDELKSLLDSKQAALDSLDVKYATALDEKINNLKKQRDKTYQSYVDYNNDVRLKNAEYARKRQKYIDQYMEESEAKKREQEQYESKHGYTGDKQENYSRRFELAYDFYSSLSPDVAYDALMASPNMRYYLGEYYFNRLSSTLKNRNGGTTVYL